MPTMPTIPAIENQRKIPFVTKLSPSLRKINETNDNQSIQEYFEDESRTTRSGSYKNNKNDVP